MYRLGNVNQNNAVFLVHLDVSNNVCCACRETVRKVTRLHQWDVARANKAPFAFGLEPRVPFLDKAFLATSMSIDPQDKMVMGLLFLQCW